MDKDLLPFAAMMAEASKRQEPALLLGNGFGRAWDDERFRYDSLLGDADLNARARRAFQLFRTADFENAMRTLLLVGELLSQYPRTEAIQDLLAADIEGIRAALLHAIRRHHPARPRDVTTGEYDTCIRFLNRFHTIFTLNYDLLLYWAICEMVTRGACRFDDGFRRYDDELLWKPSPNQQTIFHIHGALHIIDGGRFPRKLAFADRGRPIIDQLEAVFQNGEAPLFVSDGMGEAKLAAIDANPYLRNSYRALSNNTRPLVVFGTSFGDSDGHIIDAISESNTSVCFVGVYEQAPPVDKLSLQERCSTLRDLRRARRMADATAPSLDIRFYSTDGVHVWR